jgi:hypothetical protein
LLSLNFFYTLYIEYDMTEDNRFLKAYEEHKREKSQRIENNQRFECLRDKGYSSGNAFKRALVPPHRQYYKEIQSRYGQPRYESVNMIARRLREEKMTNNTPIDNFPPLSSKQSTTIPSHTHILPESTIPHTKLIDTGVITLSFKNGQVQKTREIIEVPVRAPVYTCWADVLKQ